jgi:hypothetical protein
VTVLEMMQDSDMVAIVVSFGVRGGCDAKAHDKNDDECGRTDDNMIIYGLVAAFITIPSTHDISPPSGA